MVDNLINLDLPDSWVRVKLSEISKVITGTTPKKSQPKYYGGNHPFFKPTELNQGYYVKSSVDSLTENGLEQSRRIPAKSILVTCIGATIGKTGFSRVDGACNQQINAIVPIKIIIPELIYFICISPDFQKNIIKKSSSTTLPILNKSKFESLHIPLPPLAEQQRIVDKIEELFSDLDSGIDSLKKAKQQLKVYRQAVLKWAFEGKLTAQWREEQQRRGKLASADTLLAQIKAEREQRYQKELEAWQAEVEAWEANGKEGKKPTKPKKSKVISALTKDELSDFPAILETWKWCRTSDIADKITDGEHSTPRRTEEGYYLLSARNVQNGYLSFEKVDYIPKDEYQRIIKRCHPQEDDILISCSGTIGRICRVPKNLEFTMVRSVALIKIQSNRYLSKYLEYQLQGPFLQKVINSKKKATAQANLFIGPISELPIALASSAEQEKIVEEIESRLSICDRIEADIETNLKKAEALRQSILKQAFEGKLVPQDSSDEPASVLLERIRAEREAEKGNGKGRAKTRKGDN